MNKLIYSTRFAGLSRERASLALVITAVTVGCTLITASISGPETASPSPGDRGDLDLFRRITDRVHSGEGYYDAFGSELRTRSYGTRSLFNWRTPLLTRLIAGLPDPAWSRRLLATVALVTMVMAFLTLEREGGILMAAMSVPLLFFSLIGCFVGDVFYFSELWAGALLVLSICAYCNNQWPLGVAAGLIALFLRELTLPYVVVSMAIARQERRNGELLSWMAGLAAYGVFFGLHALEVSGRISADDPAYPTGWVQFGGLRFLLAIAGMNGLLMALPKWVTAIYFPLSLLGIAGWRGCMGRRVQLVVGAYTFLFAVIGKPFNVYWGLLYTPLLSFGFAGAPAALRDLLRAVRGGEGLSR